MKNNKLKQKQRKTKSKLRTAKDNFMSWLENTGRTLGFFGVQVRDQNLIDEEAVLINKMTNWQNHQWQRRGRSRNIEHLEYFTNLKKYR